MPLWRVTIFWPALSLSRRGHAKQYFKVLKPVLRMYADDPEPHVPATKLCFRANEPMAGSAWVRPNETFLWDDIQSIRDLKGDEDAWREQWKHKTRDGIIGRLGSNACKRFPGYMRQTRAMLCRGYRGKGYEFVLSIDSLLRNGFHSQFLKSTNHAEPAAEMERQLIYAGWLAQRHGPA